MVEEALLVLWQRQKLDNCSSALSPNARHVEVKQVHVTACLLEWMQLKEESADT